MTGALLIPAIALLGILVIEYCRMTYHLFMEDNVAWEIVAFASIASIWFMLVKADGALNKHSAPGDVLLGSAHLLAILGLYRLTTDIGSLAVSASWLFCCRCRHRFSFVRKDEVDAPNRRCLFWVSRRQRRCCTMPPRRRRLFVFYVCC